MSKVSVAACLAILAQGAQALTADEQAIVDSATAITAHVIYDRAFSIAELTSKGYWIDSRISLINEPEKTYFALAMSDMDLTRSLSSWLPTVAKGCALSGNTTLCTWATDQLEELSTWNKLQRPGWTLVSPPGTTLPPAGDGTWLATGWGVRAIADTLEILPAQYVSTALRSAINAQMAVEIAAVVDDWTVERQWFVALNAYTSNQWVLPTTGLIRACLVAGKEANLTAYELGITNMLATFNASGTAGEWDEGINYALTVLPEFYHIARATLAGGDTRLSGHSYLANSPTWLTHTMQPGGYLTNSHDATYQGITLGLSASNDYRDVMALAINYNGDTSARWALFNKLGGPRATVDGLASRNIGSYSIEPIKYANYTRATRVNWRSSWSDLGTGIWVRGGSTSDAHDHLDRGHVTYTINGQPALIEAGTPDYAHPSLDSYFKAQAGHNVLEISGETASKAAAAITVSALGEERGLVSVAPTAGYASATNWTRTVGWNATQADISDSVSLSSPKVLILRWHLGAKSQPIYVANTANSYTITWDDIEMIVGPRTGISLAKSTQEDQTLQPASSGVGTHQMLLIQTQAAVSSQNFSATIRRRTPIQRTGHAATRRGVTG